MSTGPTSSSNPTPDAWAQMPIPVAEPNGDGHQGPRSLTGEPLFWRPDPDNPNSPYALFDAAGNRRDRSELAPPPTQPAREPAAPEPEAETTRVNHFILPPGNIALPGQPPQRNGTRPDTRSFDIDRAAEHTAPAQPVTDDQLFSLFLPLLRSREYFEEVRPRLLPDYFDSIYESQWQVLWSALCRCYDRYGAPDYPTLLQTASDEMRENLAVQLTEEQFQQVFSEDAFHPGIVKYAFDLPADRLGPSLIHMADEVLNRFLFERRIVTPLRRLTTRTFLTPGAYPEDLGRCLTALSERYQQLLDEASGDSGLLTLEDLEDIAEQSEELIRGVLVAYELGIIGGMTKVLKTLLALAMAIALATGTRWLGREGWEALRPMRVAFISGETSARALSHKARVMLRVQAAGLPEEEVEQLEALRRANLHFRRDLPDLGDPASVLKLVSLVRSQRIEVLFLDPLNGCLGAAAKEAANTPLTTRVMLDLAQKMAAAGCTLILVHHTAGDRFRNQAGRAHEPLELADLAWPGITNSVRQWVLVARAEDYELDTRTSELWLSIGGSGMQAGGEFHVTVVEGRNHDQWHTHVQTRTAALDTQDSENAREEAQRQREYEGWLMGTLRANPNGISLTDLVRHSTKPARWGEANIRRMLLSLGDRRVRVENRRWFAVDDGPASPAAGVACSAAWGNRAATTGPDASNE